jgi:hypothetical protein
MRCHRIGCQKAARDALAYAYLSAVYALNLTRRRYGAGWSPEQADYAECIAHRRAQSRVSGPSGNPNSWSTQPTSLVNWFAGFIEKDIRTELQRKFALIEDKPSDLPTDRHRAATPTTSVKPTNVDIDPTDRRWDSQPAGLMWGTTFRSPEDAVIIDEHSDLLREELRGLIDTLLTKLSPLEPSGADSPRPRELMLICLADFQELRRSHADGSYGIGRTSERQITRDHLVRLDPDHEPTQRDFDRTQSAIRRTRTNILIPTCQDLMADQKNTLTRRQRIALKAIIDHINGDPVTLPRPPRTPNRSHAATTSADPQTTEAGPR